MIAYILTVLVLVAPCNAQSCWPNKEKIYTYEEVKDWAAISQMEPGYVDDNHQIVAAYIPTMSERYRAVKEWRDQKKSAGELTPEQEKVLDAIVSEGDDYCNQWNDLMAWTQSEKNKN